MPPSDAELVLAAQRGDHTSFIALVDQYKSLLCSIAFEITGSLIQSEDVSQEVFVQAWSRLAELREPARFRSWICGIARNLSLNVVREQRVRPPARAKDLRVATDLAAADPSPLDEIISREEERLLRRALGRLPEPYRRAIELYYREDGSVEKVARVLDVSPVSVKKRLSRGRRLLGEQVHALVRSALGRRPGKSFTLGVGAAIATVAAPRKTDAATRMGGRQPLLAGVGAALILGTGVFLANTTRPHADVAPQQPSAPAAPLRVRRLHAPPLLTAESLLDAGSWAAPRPEGPFPDILSLDFEDGIAPRMMFNAGVVVGDRCPPPSRFCAMATLSTLYHTMEVDLMAEGERFRRSGALFRHSDGLVLSFDYWVGARTNELYALINNRDKNENHFRRWKRDNHELHPDQWTHVDVRLADFAAEGPAATRPEPGDRIFNLMFTILESSKHHVLDAPFYLDNIRIHELE